MISFCVLHKDPVSGQMLGIQCKGVNSFKSLRSHQVFLPISLAFLASLDTNLLKVFEAFRRFSEITTVDSCKMVTLCLLQHENEWEY